MRTPILVGLVTLALLILPSSPALARPPLEPERIEERLILEEQLDRVDEEIKRAVAQTEADVTEAQERAFRELQSTPTPAVKHALAQQMQQDVAAIRKRGLAEVDRLRQRSVRLQEKIAALPDRQRNERICGTAEARCGTGHGPESFLKTWSLPLAVTLLAVGAMGALAFVRLR